MDPDDVRADWADRSGKYSPEYYADIGPNVVSETLTDVLDHYVGTDATILEIGCGSGRHLAALLGQGYENLSGIDINDEAFEVMADQYPTLHDRGTFHIGAIEELVSEFDTAAFDVVYTVETLQHIHPDDEWVFEEIARIAGDILITAENEGNSPQRGRGETAVSQVDDEFPLYHRNWKTIFAELGFAQLIREPTKRDTIRVFRTV
ncbi:class I SAM-dependent methyltransferase [Haloarcula sp. GH36]|uniref:class I SAM-dependent methyltransferase n=1 Tax=Haloarcula montana TaxID=3111776 RepID=UPI002D766051|nr:class I SAM-dependent methyltransferase [Haloarcula sp. GH36]